MISAKRIIRFFSYMIICILSTIGMSNATVYFYYDAENATIGQELPHHQSSGVEFCQGECGSSNQVRGKVANEGGAPQGKNYFRWDLNNTDSGNTTSCIYDEVTNKDAFPISLVNGRTYYVAFYSNFTRINGKDIWHTCENCQSGDKGVEVYGNGLRWEVARGQWDSYPANDAHKFTVWLGNPGYDLNRSLEHNDVFYQNQNGYNGTTNPIQLDYERWFSTVYSIKIANDNTGAVALYIDGTKILEYTGIRTVSVQNATIQRITFEGTIAQPAYDAPAHIRKFDALMLTDNWQDIINGGYLAAVASNNSQVVISNNYPAKYSTGFYKDATLSMNIQSDSGVDQSSIQMTVNNQIVPVNISGSPNNYTVSYKPSSSFESGSQVSVTIKAAELANSANVTTESYWFKVGKMWVMDSQNN